MPPRQESKLLIFSDLDGTLLDHHTYSFAPALPALERLKRAKIPVILTTSKTLAEVQELKHKLGNEHPCILENGSAVWIPAGYFFLNDAAQTEVLGVPAERIHQVLDQLPGELRSQIQGFRDMTDADVAAVTGLPEPDAARARQRAASEPFLWSGTEEEIDQVRGHLEQNGLSLKRGGRFYHAQGKIDKADALQWLARRYGNETIPLTVALGDGHNDIGMLKAAGIGILVENPDGPSVNKQIAGTAIRVAAPGPAGWNVAVQQVLDQQCIS